MRSSGPYKIVSRIVFIRDGNFLIIFRKILLSAIGAPALFRVFRIVLILFSVSTMLSLSVIVSLSSSPSAAIMSAAALPWKCVCSAVHVFDNSGQSKVIVLNVGDNARSNK